jgi:predicted transport protein
MNKEKRRFEFPYWKKGIKRAINGYNDAEFNELFINFINDLNFALLTLDEKDLIFSFALKYNTISRKAQDYIMKWYRVNNIQPEIIQSHLTQFNT